jgi:hypothetical protein
MQPPVSNILFNLAWGKGWMLEVELLALAAVGQLGAKDLYLCSAGCGIILVGVRMGEMNVN